MARSLSPPRSKEGRSQKSSRRESEINIQCNPDLPFGRYFNRELSHMKKRLKLKNELIDEVFESILDTKYKVISRYVLNFIDSFVPNLILFYLLNSLQIHFW